MRIRVWAIGVIASSTIAGMAHGQALQRRATRMGGGSPDRGKCTIEVVVDGAADVEIRGENATLRNLSGQPPQWRRFECTSPMPVNPPNFRFSGVDGRGRQELVRAPQNGGMAVVRIQDSGGGSEGYTFDLTWGGGGNDRTFGGNPPPVEPGRRFTTDQAVRVCQDAVRQQAFDRFHTQNVAFRRTALDDNPGRRDYVTGLMDIRRGYDRDEVYRFSCSVNFDTGEVRSAQIDPADRDRDRPEAPPAPSPTRIAMDGCQRAVEDRIRNNGYQHVDIVSINVDDRPGRNDWIVGVARADIRSRSDSYNFSCSVNLRDGDVRSVDVRRR